MHYIADNLKFYRRHNRFTQEEIAGRLGATVGQIKTYEGGIATPQIEMLIKISDMIGVTLDTLVRVELSEKTYLKEKRSTLSHLEQRVKALEKAVFSVNNIVNNS